MIVVTGEALIDLIPTSDGELSISVGGGPLNTARWLARLGAEVGFLGAVSSDVMGERIRTSLTNQGVSLELVVDTKLPTTLALAQLDEGCVAQYSFYVERTSAADVTVEAALTRLPEALDALYVGGLGLMLEPIGQAVEATVRAAHSEGALVMLDPNIRPSLIADQARYMERFTRLLAQTDVLKLSAEDLAWLVPGESPIAAVHELSQRGPSLVLLTAGPAGATALTATGEFKVPAVQVAVVDTIGAGDAFSAGFLAHWSRVAHGCRIGDGSRVGDNAELIRAAAHSAAKAAAVACSHPGATPPPDLALSA